LNDSRKRRLERARPRSDQKLLVEPGIADVGHDRVWDWSDPQFLR
jgi:hypothetical protein